MNTLNTWFSDCKIVISFAGGLLARQQSDGGCFQQHAVLELCKFKSLWREKQMGEKCRSTFQKLRQDFFIRGKVAGVVFCLAAVSFAWVGLGGAAPAPSLTIGRAVYSSDSRELKVDLRGRNLPTEIIQLYDDVTGDILSQNTYERGTLTVILPISRAAPFPAGYARSRAR
jgi:hypothetical protein